MWGRSLTCRFDALDDFVSRLQRRAAKHTADMIQASDFCLINALGSANPLKPASVWISPGKSPSI